MLSSLVDSGAIDTAQVSPGWLTDGSLVPRDLMEGRLLSDQVPDLLHEAGIESSAQTEYLRISNSGAGDLRNIVYADQRNGEQGFRDVLTNNVVPSGGERWNYS